MAKNPERIRQIAEFGAKTLGISIGDGTGAEGSEPFYDDEAILFNGLGAAGFEGFWVKLHPPQPLAEIGPDLGHGILPDLIDGRRQLVFVAIGHRYGDFFKQGLRPLEIARAYGQQALRRQSGEQGELDVVDQGATLERIQIVDRDSDFPEDDSLDGVRKEAVCEKVCSAVGE
jgi:hypothetical protein